MDNMEIEKKFLINTLPAELEKYPFHHIEQGYLSTAPVEEYNLPLTKESYEHLKEKADGNIISKKRYLIPLEETDLTIELDIFDPPFSPLCLAEVEFPDIESADRFIPPAWFGKDVTEDPAYHNSNMSKQIF